MTNGQIAQLQELSKCHMATYGDKNIMHWWRYWMDSYPVEILTERKQYFCPSKVHLRRMMHQYRHQIAAMKRNRK